MTIALEYPFTGRWVVQNSPANAVPSHGTTLFATAQAIDFVPVDDRGRSARFTLGSLLRPEPSERFTGFGRPILAPLSGTVAAVVDGHPDHAAFRGLPSIGYALSQRSRAREGWPGLAGNHVILRAAPRVLVALCHLQRGSIAVVLGQHVAAGTLLGRCGNSGNSTEPHLHLQALDGLDPAVAQPLPLTFPDGLPRNRTIVDAGPPST